MDFEKKLNEIKALDHYQAELDKRRAELDALGDVYTDQKDKVVEAGDDQIPAIMKKMRETRVALDIAEARYDGFLEKYPEAAAFHAQDKKLIGVAQGAEKQGIEYIELLTKKLDDLSDRISRAKSEYSAFEDEIKAMAEEFNESVRFVKQVQAYIPEGLQSGRPSLPHVDHLIAEYGRFKIPYVPHTIQPSWKN